MLGLSLLFVLLTHPIKTAYVTNTPSFADKLDKFYEKLEKINVHHETTTKSDDWYQNLEKLNAVGGELTDEDEELLMAMQDWGRLGPEQVNAVVKELQRIRDERDEDRSDRLVEQEYDDDEEYADQEYHNDGKNDEDDEELETSSLTPVGGAPSPSVTPIAFTKLKSLKVLGPGHGDNVPSRDMVLSAVDPIAATNERPKILDTSGQTPRERSELRKAAMANMARMLRAGKCLVPQPRWLKVRQLAPAADIVYMPPCVELHRCAPDAGCCNSEEEVCAPIDGEYISLPFYLHRANGNMEPARMSFYNHTQCACVSRDTLKTTVRTHLHSERRPTEERHLAENGQSILNLHVTEDRHITDDRQPTEDRHLTEDIPHITTETRNSLEEISTRAEPQSVESRSPSEERQNDLPVVRVTPSATEQPVLDDDVTDPPQMRRCTCPAQFLASLRGGAGGGCACVCAWRSVARRRDCALLARGREHFGMRDRVCVRAGDCTPPTCEYGPYDAALGRCPQRRYRRIRYHASRYHPDKTPVV